MRRSGLHAGPGGDLDHAGAGAFQEFHRQRIQVLHRACKVAAVGGFVGSDLFTYWESAIKAGVKKYPNVTVVVDEPANFDPRMALKKIQDALLAHPDITIVLSSWDDMSRGVEQAIIAAGKTPATTSASSPAAPPNSASTK